MPILFDKAFDIARAVKAFVNPERGVTRGVVPGVEGRPEEKAEDPKNARRRMSEQRERIESQRRELSRIREEESAANGWAEIVDHRMRKRRAQQEIFRLRRELRAAKEGAAGEQQTGALPDFAIIGAMKGGTSFLYHLLTQHPLVEPAAFKEPHYFDLAYDDEGVEWYRRCFPAPERKDGRRTITGEGTPYLPYAAAPERMAGVIPEARLIALLRNPVDRAHSHYQMMVRRGWESRTLEEALGVEEARLRGERHKAPEDRHHASPGEQRFSYLSWGIYVDQLLRWSEFFGEEQLLVLKSEDFFEDPVGSLKPVLSFLGLPEWEPEASELGDKRNTGGYETGMDSAARRRLEEFFEPHNERLYDHLGVDLGW